MRVQLGLAKIACSSGWPTLRRSMSNAATNSTSLQAVAAYGLAHDAFDAARRCGCGSIPRPAPARWRNYRPRRWLL